MASNQLPGLVATSRKLIRGHCYFENVKFIFVDFNNTAATVSLAGAKLTYAFCARPVSLFSFSFSKLPLGLLLKYRLMSWFCHS